MNAKQERNLALMERRDQGLTRKELAAEFGVCVERVRQIIWREERRRAWAAGQVRLGAKSH